MVIKFKMQGNKVKDKFIIYIQILFSKEIFDRIVNTKISNLYRKLRLKFF